MIWKILYWVPFALFTAGLTWMALSKIKIWQINTITGMTVAIFAPFGVFATFSFLGKCIGAARRGHTKFRRQAEAVGFYAGIVAGLITFGSGVYGLSAGWRRVVVMEIPLAFDNLPEAFDGYRIAHISDLHIGTYSSSMKTLKEIVDKIEAEHPDMIAFTGDMINIYAEELSPFVGELKKLHAPDGVWSIMGNHDYCAYGGYANEDEEAKAIQRLHETEKEAGFRMLLNENEIIHKGTDSLALIGVEYIGMQRKVIDGNLGIAMENVPEGTFKILLSHDPTHWHNDIRTEENIDLTLSGHTHAMQFKIGRFSPSMFLFKEWGGIYTSGKAVLNVNTGTGGNIPFRLGAWPEIDILVLKRAEAQ